MELRSQTTVCVEFVFTGKRSGSSPSQPACGHGSVLPAATQRADVLTDGSFKTHGKCKGCVVTCRFRAFRREGVSEVCDITGTPRCSSSFHPLIFVFDSAHVGFVLNYFACFFKSLDTCACVPHATQTMVPSNTTGEDVR